LIYDNTQDEAISAISQTIEYFSLLFERVNYQNIEINVFINQAQISFFKLLVETQKVKVFPKLRRLYFTPELNIEDFFTLFNASSFPNLKELSVKLTIPGDI